MNRMVVKVCGFVHPDDVRQAVAEDLDAVGVVLDRGPHRVEPEAARPLIEAARGSGKEVVGVAGECTVEDVHRWLRLGFDRVQAVLRPEDAERLGPDIPVLPVLFDGVDLVDRARALHARYPFRRPDGPGRGLSGLLNVDGQGGGGTGARADPDRARRVAAEFGLVLSGGLRPDNVGPRMAHVKPCGVDVSSATNAPDGRKSLSKIRAFVEAVRTFEREHPIFRKAPGGDLPR